MNTILLWSDERIEQRAEQCIDDIAAHSITDTPRWVEQALKEMRDEYQARITALEQAAPAMEPVSDDVMGAIKSLIVHAEATDMLPYSRNVVIAWLMLQRPATAAGEEE